MAFHHAARDETSSPVRDTSALPSPDDTTCQWMRLVRQLIKSTRHMRRIVGDVGIPLGITDTELLCLFCCVESSGDGITQNALAEEIGVSAAQISSVVERLKQRDWLTGCRGRRDRRRIYWRLTEAGRAMLCRLSTVLSPMARGWDREIPPSEFNRLMAAMRQLTRLSEQPAVLRRVGPPDSAAEYDGRTGDAS
jgi:DNA-binding MarR family transcriptional regulator